MNKIQMDAHHQEHLQKKRLTLSEYVYLRTGVPMGASASLRNMLYRSLGASSFARFWQYWNPIWGYGLGKYVYAPVKQILPPALALIITFIVSGGIHDLVSTAVRGSVAFLFTPWFFLLSIGVVLSRAVNMDVSDYPWGVRAGINLCYISICLVVTLIGKHIFLIP